MNTVAEYINSFDKETQQKLNALRELITKTVPESTERICMGIPTYDLNGKWLVHFAAFKKHIGFYPDPDGILAFQDRLKGYKTSKGTVQFPLNKPLPMELIREIIEYRVKSQQIGIWLSWYGDVVWNLYTYQKWL